MFRGIINAVGFLFVFVFPNGVVVLKGNVRALEILVKCFVVLSICVGSSVISLK